MKKLVSLLLMVAIVMSFATITVTSVSAEENEDLVAAAASDDAVSVGAGTDVSDSGTSGKVYFVKPDNWVGTMVYCHIYEATGEKTPFFDWQSKKEKCTEEGGKFVYDLSILDDSAAQVSGGLETGSDYNIMFCDNTGNESYPIMFNTNCIGDTVKIVNDDKPFENEKSWEGSWTNNADKYGIPLQITPVGTIKGKFIPAGTTVDDIIAAWDKEYPTYPNELSFSPQSSARDHKTRLAELKTELHKMAAEGKIYIAGGGVYSETSSSNDGSSNGGSSNNGSSDGSNNGGSVSSPDGSSSGSSDGGSSLTTKDGKNATKDVNGNYVDENGNVADANDVVETTGSVSTGERTTYIFVTLGVMLLAAGVYFVTRKRKAYTKLK